MRYIFGVLLCLFSLAVQGQKIESIHFHLYTDSLKKGTHNYINVDAKMTDGSWRPLTSRDILFKSDYGTFEGNNLILPESPAVKKVTVTATLRSDTLQTKQVTIWIKQQPDPPLPVYDKNTDMRRRR
ncbi:hypothetical protein PIECOFPK_00989 [Mycovorax composti]|jgi:hypothetical protein|uniref:Uncharacterized protein n=2 Tax=Chitinophagaceae TaxID=563835 RepID=A0ABZ2EIH1_9BACT